VFGTLCRKHCKLRFFIGLQAFCRQSWFFHILKGDVYWFVTIDKFAFVQVYHLFLRGSYKAARCLVVLLVCRTQLVNVVCFYFIFEQLIIIITVRAICVVSFGMQHDTPENGCESRPGEVQHVMSPQMSIEASPLIWSECSRKAVTVFLEWVPIINLISHQSHCYSRNTPSSRIWRWSFRFRRLNLQEAQLPLRNRASAMHFFVAKLVYIAVITYSYVYHLRNLRLAKLLRTQRMNFSMRPQHVFVTRDPTVVWCLLSREPLWIPA